MIARKFKQAVLTLIVAVGMIVATTSPSHALCLLCGCSVTSSGVAFLTYDPLLAAPKNVNGTVSVSCAVISGLVALVVAYEIQLGPGTFGTFATRKMSYGANRLGYNFYTNSSRTIIWGDGTSGTSSVFDTYLVSLGAATTQNYTVYGQIPMQQNVPAGPYTDTVVIQVTY